MITRPHPLNATFEFIDIACFDDFPGVLRVSLDRPRKRNAINNPLWKEIGRVFSTVASDGDVRCILLTGNGSSFCAGIDVGDSSFFPPVSSGDAARSGLSFQTKLREMQDCFSCLESCPVPIVASVHGQCIGAGIDLICAADVRICSPEATFSVREVALGLAADVGTLQRLPKITGNQSWVNEVCLTGRNFGAGEALAMGLVSKLSEKLQDEALKICIQISRHSPVAVHGTKRSLLYSRDHTVADGLEQISLYNSLALQSEDLPTAFAARIQKQPPQFSDLLPFSKL